MDTNLLKAQVITPAHVQKGQSYAEYRTMIDQLLAENKTTGADHSESLLEYTKMNVQRMKRLDKTTKLTEETIELLSQIKQPQIWLVITEAWCGDAAQIVPVLEKMAQASANVELKLILRDENLEVMDAYLTNNARSIPKLIVLDARSLEEIGVWGPRPDYAQEMVVDYKKNNNETYQEFSTRLHKWYAQDKTLSTQKELNKAFREWI